MPARRNLARTSAALARNRAAAARRQAAAKKAKAENTPPAAGTSGSDEPEA